MKQIIYITGYPRSGNMWLGRLLADVLGCEYNSADGEAGDWPGDRTDAPYIVRKGHVLDTPDLAHTVFIYRDPRDVATSIYHYLALANIRSAINAMNTRIEKFSVGAYQSFVETWWNTDKAVVQIEYGELHAAPLLTLRRIVERVTDLKLSDAVYQTAIKRQAIAEVQKKYRDWHHMRKGVMGDWVNYFTRGDGQLMQDHFGDLMLKQQYISDSDWWKALPL